MVLIWGNVYVRPHKSKQTTLTDVTKFNLMPLNVWFTKTQLSKVSQLNDMHKQIEYHIDCV